MDAKTQQMLVTMGAGIAKKVLMLQAAALVSHGVMSSNYTEVFVSLGMAAIGAVWSFWQDYGKAIVLSQLEVLKAKSLAQAAKMKDAGVPPVTVNQIAMQSSKMTPADVTKAVASLPAEVQSNVAPTVVKILLVAFVLSAFLAGDPASAQVKRLTGNIGNDLGITRAVPTSSDPLANIIGALDAKHLPDLQYAKVMADASGSKVTAPCFGAWIDLINVRQKAVTGTDGQPLPFPDPGVISRFEQLVELRNALQPDSSFMIACSPVASMVKKDIVGFIGIVISGGAGLATLVPGL